MQRIAVLMGIGVLLAMVGRGNGQERPGKDAAEPVPAQDDDPACTAAPCSGPAGDWSYCGENCLCDLGQGDCDTDEDCGPGLYCKHDMGAFFGWDVSVDVCLERCPDVGAGGWTFCSATCPCDELEGDCDGDEQCMPGLVCIYDIGALFGWDPEVDVCMHPSIAAK